MAISTTGKTPRDQGYRMPPEWHPHTATWLSWPRREGVSFPGRYGEVIPTIVELVRTLGAFEKVNINVSDDAMYNEVKRTLEFHGVARFNIQIQDIPTNEPWCRDHGPTFLLHESALGVRGAKRTQYPLVAVDWDYNAWGGKYPPFELDDAVPQKIAHILRTPLFKPGLVLEGGAIEVNGEGTLLTTESCVLNPNRNPGLSKPQTEKYLTDYLGVTNILWLAGGLAGDDTDGHIDNLARFVGPNTVVVAVEEDPADDNFGPLQDNLNRLREMKNEKGQPFEVFELPMPGVVQHDSQRLPASYCNFYIANGVVVLPTYQSPHDARAQEILQPLFPDRRVVAIDSVNLIWGLGSFHCLTQQQPAVP